MTKEGNPRRSRYGNRSLPNRLCKNWTSVNTRSIPPHSTPIWHFRHRIFAVKICSCWMFVQQAQLNTLGFLSALTRIYQSISGCPNPTEMIISSLLFIPTASMSDPLVIKLRINRSFFNIDIYIYFLQVWKLSPRNTTTVIWILLHGS